ncbi:DUF6023 family protein [Paractinoplanes durhamensis]|uniref:Uncharacterized protein n=1 Tax=Paractinoplanes durhamensis TaxID=113563 RepID=A0ABQ3Z7S6_9ACTN|nr:DUF6023 family protein [Actinoplanes durhamensis]GIE05811.1 hypothetical protein Adu01nite_71610 [Actinoplanes durhamensis]
MSDRVRGVVLYACAALLLAGGGVWWFRAAPRNEVDPRIERWRAEAQRLLPAADDQSTADTVPMAAGAERQMETAVDTGEYLVTVVCVGGTGSQVRVSLGEAGTDSGRGVNCGGELDNFTVGTAGTLRMNVSVNDVGPVIFRYSLLLQPS